METTNENQQLSIEFRFEDLSDEGIEKMDEELQRSFGLSIADVEADETALFGLHFFLDEKGAIRQQYYVPEGSPNPFYEFDFDLSQGSATWEIGDFLTEEGLIVADMEWDCITQAKKDAIRAELKKAFGKTNYRFTSGHHLGTAILNISEYLN